MQKIRTIKRFVSVLLIISLLPINYLSAHVQAYEDTNTESLDNVHINKQSKYLYLGDNKEDSYDFDVDGIKPEKVEEYFWLIQPEQGNPKAVSIDQTSGEVVANEAGTAYIYCQIKLNEGTVLKPEAKVIVVNNITEVQLISPSDNNTITAGKPSTFDKKIVNTSDGEGKQTEGITGWEILDDTAGVGIVDSNGIVYPTKAGSFRIRAVCFRDEISYKRWLRTRTEALITAASDWQTIQVLTSDGTAVANNQEQLEKALATEEFKQISLITDQSVTITMKENDYSDKVLIVDAPNADIHNYAKFLKINVNAVKESTWVEYADGNIIYLLDNQLRFVIEEGSEVKQIVIDQADSAVEFEIHGFVNQITVTQPAVVNLTGSADNIPLTIEENARQSKLTTSIPVKVTMNADAKMILDKGSEGSSINKSKQSIEAVIENKSIMPTVITTNNIGSEIIYAGRSGISNELTYPSSSQEKKYVYLTGLSLWPQNMVIPVSGSAVSMFLVEPEPINASMEPITWRSVDESVATIDGDGFVTAVSEGTTPIIAEVGEIYAMAYVTVVSGSSVSVIVNANQSGLLKSSVGSAIAKELAKGAAQYAGGQIMGWGLAQAGIDLEDATTTELKNMKAQLNELSSQLTDLKNQLKSAMDRIINQIETSEYNTRNTVLNNFTSTISNTMDQMNIYINSLITNKDSQQTREAYRDFIIKTIESELVPKEDLLQKELTGANGTTSLLVLFSKVIHGKRRFLSNEDSKIVQTMYDYYEAAQTNLMILLVEYYHAKYGEGYISEQNVERITSNYVKNIEEQKEMLKAPIPRGVVIDTVQNIMVYTGNYYIYDPNFRADGQRNGRRIGITYKGPWSGTVGASSEAFSRMTYNLGYDNWRYASPDEFTSWKSASAGKLHDFLFDTFNFSLYFPKRIMTINKDLFNYIPFEGKRTHYTVYHVNDGNLSLKYHMHEGSDSIDIDEGVSFTDYFEVRRMIPIYEHYFIVCRSMEENELSYYFY